MASSIRSGNGKENESWPELPLVEGKDTYATLHMWTQVVGKIRFALTPWINHSWHVTLYVTSRGLTTSQARDTDEQRRRSVDRASSAFGGGFLR